MTQKWPVEFSSRTKSDKSDGDALAAATHVGVPIADTFPATKAKGKVASFVSEGRIEKDVFKIRSYPEVKRSTVKKCARILGKKICINWPQLWTRKGRLSVFLVVTYPKPMEKDVRDCIKFAVTGAVIAAIASANLALAGKIFAAALGACLTKKASEAAGKCNAHFDTRTTHTQWKKI